MTPALNCRLGWCILLCNTVTKQLGCNGPLCIPQLHISPSSWNMERCPCLPAFQNPQEAWRAVKHMTAGLDWLLSAHLCRSASIAVQVAETVLVCAKGMIQSHAEPLKHARRLHCHGGEAGIQHLQRLDLALLLGCADGKFTTHLQGKRMLHLGRAAAAPRMILCRQGQADKIARGRYAANAEPLLCVTQSGAHPIRAAILSFAPCRKR